MSKRIIVNKSKLREILTSFINGDLCLLSNCRLEERCGSVKCITKLLTELQKEDTDTKT
jgi:hypothetical protein